MLSLTFEINGKKVDPRNMADALEAAMLGSVQKTVTRRLATVRCPVHGAAPTVVCSGASLGDLSFQVTGCCQALIDATKEALA